MTQTHSLFREKVTLKIIGGRMRQLEVDIIFGKLSYIEISTNWLEIIIDTCREQEYEKGITLVALPVK